MAIRTIRWIPEMRPNLAFDYWLDDEESENPSDPWLNCTAAWLLGGKEPVELDDPVGRHQRALDENRKKNRADGIVCDSLPESMKKPIVDGDGDPTGDFVVKDKHRPVWSWDKDGETLVVAIPGLTEEARKMVASALAEDHSDVVVS